MRITYKNSRSPLMLRNSILSVLAALLVNSLLLQAAYGCNVTEVKLYIGQTQQEAGEKTSTDKTVCCTFYWLLTWKAGEDDSPTFTVVFEREVGSTTYEVFRKDAIPGDQRSLVWEVTGVPEGASDYKVVGKVKRNADGANFEESNSSTATVIEVSSIDTNPSGKSVVCINESVNFEATTSSGADYDMVNWSGGESPYPTKEGSETFTTAWTATGTKTVKACCSESCKEYQIEVIDGLTVLPEDAYVCTNGTKEFGAWVCEGGAAVKKTSTDGVEWTASNGSFSGDTYDPDDVSASVGADTVTATFDGDEDSAVVTNFKCEVTSADVCEDEIHVDLGPEGLSGMLKLELTGDSGSHTIREVTRSSGSYDETFDVPNLSEGEYTAVKATWTVGESECPHEYGYHIKVLGQYNHTCYNTPYESDCSGSNEWFSYTTGDCVNVTCTWTNAQGKSEWLDEIEENGSGKGASGSIYSLEFHCTGGTYSPKLRKTGAPCAQCGGTVSEGDVAVGQNPDLACGDEICVYGHGKHKVIDKGGGVEEDQLDHYTGVSACNVCTPPGSNIMTIKISSFD